MSEGEQRAAAAAAAGPAGVQNGDAGMSTDDDLRPPQTATDTGLILETVRVRRKP